MPDSVLLFYRYVAIDDVQAEVAAQQSLCERLGVAGGRIRVAPEGLNGTLAAPEAAVAAYIAHMEADERYQGTDWKVSSCGDQSAAEVFPEGLLVQRVAEVVSSGGALADVPLARGGVHLSPAKFHEAVEGMLSGQGATNTILLDVRNHYEQLVGRFTGATNPMTRSFGEFVSWVDEHVDELQGADRVLMYCTGGVRCEKASAYVNMAVGAGSTAGKVMQLQGGIHRYLEEYGEAGLFCGSNFVFDNRVEVPPQGKAQTTTTATATTTTTTASAANGSESRRGLPEALSESSKPADVSERTAGSISSAIRRKVEETKLAVGSCEECGGKNVAESAGTRLVLPVRLQDGVRCRSCRMLVMACDACTQRHGIDLFCSKCRAEGLGGRGRMEIQSGIDSLKRRFENPRFRGRRNKSRRLALRRKLALLEERYRELD